MTHGQTDTTTAYTATRLASHGTEKNPHGKTFFSRTGHDGRIVSK